MASASPRAIVDLPEPDSPTSPGGLALAELERDAVDRVNVLEPPAQQDAAGEREVLDEAPRGDERLAHAQPPLGRAPSGSARFFSSGRWQASA
jgi:hypothetical protein